VLQWAKPHLYSLGTTLSTYGLSCSPASFAMDANPNAAPRVLLSDAAWFARSCAHQHFCTTSLYHFVIRR